MPLVHSILQIFLPSSIQISRAELAYLSTPDLSMYVTLEPFLGCIAIMHPVCQVGRINGWHWDCSIKKLIFVFGILSIAHTSDPFSIVSFVKKKFTDKDLPYRRMKFKTEFVNFNNISQFSHHKFGRKDEGNSIKCCQLNLNA